MTSNEPDRSSDASNDRLTQIARAAAERSAARRADEERRASDARLAHERRIAAAVAALQSEVIPVLENAKLTFESEGMPAQISNNFEHRSAPQAHVVFECCGPFVSDAYGKMDLVASNRALFFHDGSDLQVGIAKSFGTEVASRTRVVGDVVPHLLAALEQVVESFYLDVERRCRATAR